MTATGKKSCLTIVLTLFVFCTFIGNVEALYIFEWQDDGLADFSHYDYSSHGEINLWEGTFTIPDSGLFWGDWEGDYRWGRVDISQYLDFSLSGTVASGNYMEATSFSERYGDLGVSQSSESSIINTTTGGFTFTMEAPSWLESPLELIKSDQDSWLNYSDVIYDAEADTWRTMSLSHYGRFQGRYVEGVPPVPEPSTFLLLGCGLATLAWRVRTRSMNIRCYI